MNEWAVHNLPLVSYICKILISISIDVTFKKQLARSN